MSQLHAGTLLWRISLGAQVFAPLALLPPLPSGTTAHQCRIPGLSLGTPPHAVAVADQQGKLHVLCCSCGEAAWAAVTLMSGETGSGTSAATGAVADMDHILGRLHALWTGSGQLVAGAPGKGSAEVRLGDSDAGAASGLASAEAALPAQAGATLSEDRPISVVWCRNDGIVGVLQCPTGRQGVADHDDRLMTKLCGQQSGGGWGVKAVQMPADTFSAPVAFGPFVVLGCRDDYLYCLSSQ